MTIEQGVALLLILCWLAGFIFGLGCGLYIKLVREWR